MNCNGIVLSPFQKKVCFFSGLIFGSTSVLGLGYFGIKYISSDAAKRNALFLNYFVRRTSETLNRKVIEPTLETADKAIESTANFINKHNEKAFVYGLGSIVISSSVIFIPLTLYGIAIDIRNVLQQNNHTCCTLARSGIKRSIAYPTRFAFIGLSSYSSYLWFQNIKELSAHKEENK